MIHYKTNITLFNGNDLMSLPIEEEQTINLQCTSDYNLK